jgi:hypothetical protein
VKQQVLPVELFMYSTPKKGKAGQTRLDKHVEERIMDKKCLPQGRSIIQQICMDS